ncbi:hypothetical protein LEMLEM_LOCUS10753 [Lemmus lemmus]
MTYVVLRLLSLCPPPGFHQPQDLLCIQCSACVFACTPEGGTRSHYKWLRADMWLLGTELRTSGRTVPLDGAQPHPASIFARFPDPTVIKAREGYQCLRVY